MRNFTGTGTIAAMNILIVEGNPVASIEAGAKAGVKPSHVAYRQALALHAPQARYETLFALDDPGRFDLDAFDGFALTGAGVPWSAGDQEAKPYLAVLDRVLATGKPVVGSCWGLQAAAVLLGGRVAANPKGSETGIARDIVLTEEGRAHWAFKGMPDVFDQPAIHRDHVTEMPPGAIRLAGNAMCDVQAFALERDGVDFLGLQPHPEFELDHIRAIVASRPPLPGTTRVVADFPQAPSPHVADPLERTRVLGNWLARIAARKQDGDRRAAVS